MGDRGSRGTSIHWRGYLPTNADRCFCLFSLWFGSWPFRILHKSFPRVIRCYYPVLSESPPERGCYIHCICAWAVSSTGGLVLLSEVLFSIFWEKIFQVYVMLQTLLYWLFELFLPPFFLGGGGGGIFLFVCFVCFLQCCISQSMLGAKCSLCVLFCGPLFFFFYSEPKGAWGGEECACHRHYVFTVLFWVWISALQSLLSFWNFILTSIFLTYLI